MFVSLRIPGMVSEHRAKINLLTQLNVVKTLNINKLLLKHNNSSTNWEFHSNVDSHYKTEEISNQNIASQSEKLENNSK